MDSNDKNEGVKKRPGESNKAFKKRKKLAGYAKSAAASGQGNDGNFDYPTKKPAPSVVVDLLDDSPPPKAAELKPASKPAPPVAASIPSDYADVVDLLDDSPPPKAAPASKPAPPVAAMMKVYDEDLPAPAKGAPALPQLAHRSFGTTVHPNVGAAAAAATSAAKPAAFKPVPPAPPAPRFGSAAAAAAAARSTTDSDAPSRTLCEDVGRAVYDRLKESNFHQIYFDQSHALTMEQFQVELAPKFKQEFLRYARDNTVDGIKMPIQALPPDVIASWFHDRTNTPGSYLTVVNMPLDEAVALVSGEKDLSSLRLDEKGYDRLEEVRDVVEAALYKVKMFCDELDVDPTTIGGVNIGYAGLVSRQSFNTGDKKVSRFLQHYFGGMKSVNSALIEILYKSGVFSGVQLLGGVLAECEFGDNQTAGGLEVFEAGALMPMGGEVNNYNGYGNVAPVGLVAMAEDDDSKELWFLILGLRVRLGSDTAINDPRVHHSLRAAVQSSAKLRAKMVQFGAPSEDIESASLKTLHSAISGVGGNACRDKMIEKFGLAADGKILYYVRIGQLGGIALNSKMLSKWGTRLSRSGNGQKVSVFASNNGIAGGTATRDNMLALKGTRKSLSGSGREVQTHYSEAGRAAQTDKAKKERRKTEIERHGERTIDIARRASAKPEVRARAEVTRAANRLETALEHRNTLREVMDTPQRWINPKKNPNPGCRHCRSLGIDKKANRLFAPCSLCKVCGGMVELLKKHEKWDSNGADDESASAS